jgi:solute carrier family 25 (mitochondrial phosphate transporter), member 23/24/25/41
MAKESSNRHQTLTGRGSFSGAQVSEGQPTSSNHQIAPRSLAEFREQEGRANRKRRLYALWQHICRDGYLSQEQHPRGSVEGTVNSLTPDKAEKLRAAYEDELLGRCGAQSSRKQIGWTEFRNYAEAKETGM